MEGENERKVEKRERENNKERELRKEEVVNVSGVCVCERPQLRFVGARQKCENASESREDARHPIAAAKEIYN